MRYIIINDNAWDFIEYAATYCFSEKYFEYYNSKIEYNSKNAMYYFFDEQQCLKCMHYNNLSLNNNCV